jgi:hypothetical protein
MLVADPRCVTSDRIFKGLIDLNDTSNAMPRRPYSFLASGMMRSNLFQSPPIEHEQKRIVFLNAAKLVITHVNL